MAQHSPCGLLAVCCLITQSVASWQAQRRCLVLEQMLKVPEGLRSWQCGFSIASPGYSRLISTQISSLKHKIADRRATALCFCHFHNYFSVPLPSHTHYNNKQQQQQQQATTAHRTLLLRTAITVWVRGRLQRQQVHSRMQHLYQSRAYDPSKPPQLKARSQQHWPLFC